MLDINKLYEILTNMQLFINISSNEWGCKSQLFHIQHLNLICHVIMGFVIINWIIDIIFDKNMVYNYGEFTIWQIFIKSKSL